MSNPILHVKELSSGYGKMRVVNNVSFDIHAGEVFGIVGLNGAGKTTLIKTILGLRDKESGEIVVDNKDISYLPERFDPPWFLSGYDFIRFSLKLYKKDISLKEVEEAANSVSLDTAFLTKNVSTYSKGMRQKLGLLATTLTGSQLLILDEPMSGLDPKARVEVKKLIKAAKEQGKAVFMSSHVLADVAELCDKVAVFHEKTIIFQGIPQELAAKGENDNLEEAFLNIINVK